MKSKLRTWLVLALCLTACGAPGETAPEVPSSLPPAVAEDVPAEGPATPSTVEPTLPPEEETTDLPTEENEGGPDAGPASEAVFPRSFGFASGAGAWSTELEVAADGSFTGMHHDTNGGDIGEDYPNGTVYICRFSGKFSQPVKVDDLTYSLRLESIEQDETEGEETIVDGVRYIVSRPYGLDNADEIFIYLPGSRRQDLPEYFVAWVNTFAPWDTEDGRPQSEEDKLTQYGLYNVSGGQGFVSVDE